MAVDTAAKRASMLNFGDDVLLPIPDASGIEGEDRLHLLGLYGGILAGEAPEEEVVIELPIGGGKHAHYPPQPTISPLDYRRGWKEHVRDVEQGIQAKQIGVEQARKFDVPKHEQLTPEKTLQGIQTPKREKAPQPEPVNRLETNRPEQKTLEIGPSETQIKRPKKRIIRRTDERLEAASNKAAEVREENRFKAHIRATRDIAKKDNQEEEKRQRTAEKDIGYTPTQIKRDRANRAQTYQKREDFTVNLEKGRIAQAKLQAVEEVQRKEMLKRLKKARAAKKRKAKKK